MSVWTSGSSEGKHCDEEGTFAWCTTGELFEPFVTNGSERDTKNYTHENGTSPRCLTVNVTSNSTLLELSHCEKEQNVLCEVHTFYCD
jgi:hypothetical protein